MAYIYVVDDERDLTWLLEKSLSHEGYQVVCANDGVEALQLMRRQRPDLVILDVMMPGIDGIEVHRRLRSDPALSAVPVLFLTVKGAAVKDRIENFQAGRDDYLTKPFDLKELKARIEALLRQSQSSSPEALPPA